MLYLGFSAWMYLSVSLVLYVCYIKAYEPILVVIFSMAKNGKFLQIIDHCVKVLSTQQQESACSGL